MSETYPSDCELNNLSGTSDAEQEVLFVPIGESPYYTSFYKMLYRLLNVARRAGDLRVYKDGDLTFGVRAGKYFNGDTAVDYAGATGQSLTNNQTNYIYLTADGTLTVNTTGFPVPSVTPHIPLATITTSAGNYSTCDGDLVDYRGRAFLTVCGSAAGRLNLLDWRESVADELDFTSAEPGSSSIGDRYLNTATGSSSGTGQSVTADHLYEWNGTSWTEISPTEGACCLVEDRDMLIGFNGTSWVDIGTFALLNEAQAFFAATDISGSEAETLTDGSNADSLHTHATAGIEAGAITGSKLSDAVQDAMANLNVTSGGEVGDTHTVTIQARDFSDNNTAERFLVRVWVDDAEYGAPDATGNTVTVTTGTIYETRTANADYLIVSDANGTVVITLTVSGAATRYVMAEIDGRVYSSGALTFTA